ncbi:BTAD domain-containing putative transcriptional regulator [Streptomyces hoynatensis]|uniref:BTAD domain-containing putative transcriptional regulator n=1 Tax=Streptomyces hoynatensis TaxID=1141874 RepID=UPI00240D85E1|nr:BTAD domain-containing putative transcriptional regulator [Streptomyces hoynatensis]
MQVGILGPLQVGPTQGRPLAIGGARLRALLIRLALDAGCPVRVEALADAVWGEAVPADQANALQSLVSRLRRALPRPDVIVSEPGGYRLAVPPEAVDAFRFEQLAAQGHRALAAGEAAQAAGLLREALALWRGPALADAGETAYALAPAARLEELRLTAREDLYEAELALGRAAEVVAEVEELVAAQPLRERPRGLLMRTRYAAGRHAEALAAYEEYRGLLAEELGTDPSPALRELHLALLRATPPGPAPAGAWPRPARPRAALTSFIGREEELRLIAKQTAENRLVTLVGPGGAGKTRLATTTAAALAEDFPGGVWVAELAPVTGEEDVPQAVLDALGGALSLRVDPRRTPVRQDTLGLLVQALSGPRSLLVLDNCEHLVAAAALLADHLLGGCEELHILATSREPLGILGETLSPVGPLRLPRPEAPAEEAVATPAVRLFTDRAVAVRPGFVVDDSNVAAVVEICRRLDGLPLAIELAAARLRSLDPGHLAARLDDRFRLLTGGSRTAMPRHQTLRAVVAWSWELLTGPERDLAEQLAVFSGGVTPQTAEGVCGVPGPEALDLLTSLADKSLLQRAPSADAATPRFRMLETLREYGLERLAEQGRARRVRDAHAAYFLELAETAEPRLRGPEQIEWIDLLMAERDNLLAALHHAVGTEDAATAVRLAAALAMFWTMRGTHPDAAHWLDLALGVPGESPWESRAVALGFQVLSKAASGHPQEAEAAAEELREQLRKAGDGPRPKILAVLEPGLAMFGDREAEGLRLTQRGLREEDPWVRGMLRLMRAAIRENEGNFTAGHEELDLAAEEFRRAGDRWGLGMTLSVLGEAHRLAGELPEAAAAFEEAMRLMRTLHTEDEPEQLSLRLAGLRIYAGQTEGVAEELAGIAERSRRRGDGPHAYAHAMIVLGDLARYSGELAEARAHYEKVAEVFARHTFAQPQLSALLGASHALIDLAEGDLDRASERLVAAFDEALDVRDMPVAGAVGVAVACLCAARGEAERAARALGASTGVRGAADPLNPDVAALVERLRAELGADAYRAAYDRGLALPREESCALLRLAAVAADREGEEHREQAH